MCHFFFLLLFKENGSISYVNQCKYILEFWGFNFRYSTLKIVQKLWAYIGENFLLLIGHFMQGYQHLQLKFTSVILTGINHGVTKDLFKFSSFYLTLKMHLELEVQYYQPRFPI